MGKLVQVDVSVDQIRLISPLIIWLQHTICKGDCTNVFHGADPKLRHIDHVILRKREVITK